MSDNFDVNWPVNWSKFARKQIFILKRLDSMFGRALVPAGWRPFMNKVYIGLKTELYYWKGAQDEINTIHSSAVKNQGTKKKKKNTATSTRVATTTTTITHNSDTMTVRIPHSGFLHGSNVAWQGQWKYFALDRTFFFAIGKTTYCSCHATWLPCKFSIGVVTSYVLRTKRAWGFG